MSHTVYVTSTHGPRLSEPLEFSVPGQIEEDLWIAVDQAGQELLCQRLKNQPDEARTAFVTVASFDGDYEFTLDRPADGAAQGITTGEPIEDDAFVRLNTGYFDVEICSGTAQGEGSSKWGIRHFSSIEEGIDLLPSGNNAIGGFYGPFFTPENGLINPPEHTTVEIEVVEEGPVLYALRMHGTIPDGLLEELKGKNFTIDWRFTYGTPWFSRRYQVDDFQTVINGRSITNKITVGDEFEGGQGELVFDRFDCPGGVRYRAGDPYAGQLVEMVNETIASDGDRPAKFDTFKEMLSGDLESAHWDLYWRLFCSWEGALPEDEIRERLARVCSESHVLADLTDRPWIMADGPVDVQTVPHETIFPGAAQKTVEYHSELGRAMVWWTSEPSGQFQIVQRRQSGWVNWGSNGENECPELPVGVLIKTAYGQYAESWLEVADQLENAPGVTVG
ncbi:hypothetical protein H5397_16820 [Propioniciclava sp. MC1683]|uniref:hypothetical protein n=1 Tax=Propioniciclava sp. MC1683 TaxID=2760309 RepID=UPI001603F64C|nr:hypothetical protein [Propioniciclava sp. MC1683]MBB1503059.1 hypothetical protein [Propioniciclava sp. MC1683]